MKLKKKILQNDYNILKVILIFQMNDFNLICLDTGRTHFDTASTKNEQLRMLVWCTKYKPSHDYLLFPKGKDFHVAKY